MKNWFPEALHFIGGALLMFLLIGQFAFTNELKKPATSETWQPPELPKQMSFAGEPVPLNKWEIKERLDREILFNFYNTANILFLLKLSNRYFPIISERLKMNQVPDDFKYLCVAESNLLPTAVSGAGAVGFWQFMGGTAPGYNLVVNAEVDERYHIEKATDAACKYLKQSFEKFGSWTAAAASYNCGQGGYNAQATLQQTKNYYNLLLPEETNRYIFRILAFKHLLNHAEALGFSIKDEEKYQQVPYKIIRIDTTINSLTQFAINQGTSYKLVKLMNPWLRGKTLTVAKGIYYELKMPIN